MKSALALNLIMLVTEEEEGAIVALAMKAPGKIWNMD